MTAGRAASALSAIGLVGGFLAGRVTGRRDLAGALFAAAGAGSAYSWRRVLGVPAAAGLTVAYTAAMGVSHPLAKRIGAWPATLAVTAATVAASELAQRAATP